MCQNPFMTVRKRAGQRPYHHGNLRDALIEAGLRLIEQKGVKGLTLREIGAIVGVSRTAAYRHFADKAALLAAICEAGFVQFAAALEAAKSSAAADFSSQLSALALAYVRFAAEHRAIHFEEEFVSFGPVFTGPIEPYGITVGLRQFEGPYGFVLEAGPTTQTTVPLRNPDFIAEDFAIAGQKLQLPIAFGSDQHRLVEIDSPRHRRRLS